MQIESPGFTGSSDVVPWPAITASIFGLFGLALLAVSTGELLIASRLHYRGHERRISRRRRRGAAASLASEVGATRWRNVEKFLLLKSLLDQAEQRSMRKELEHSSRVQRTLADSSSRPIQPVERSTVQHCPICLDTISRSPITATKQNGIGKVCAPDPSDSRAVELQCGHTLHYSCALQFLLKCSKNCPFCNSEVVTAGDFDAVEKELNLLMCDEYYRKAP